ncbi:unnamed protein product [Rotaria socialis]
MPAPFHASQVFAFLRRNYRVSRNTRALWQFQQIAASSLNPVRIPTSEEITQSSDEIVLVSALDEHGKPIPASSNIVCNSATRFSYFTTRYKFAFILDMTDSCASVSIDGGHIYLESLTNCLCILLYSLAQTFTLPGCELKFQPEIDISVYVYFPLHRTPSHQVLIHGYRLTWATLKIVCDEIASNLKAAIELLHNVMSISQPFTAHSTSSTVDSDDNINLHLNAIYANSESSCAIINMLSYGITALQLMPEESTSVLVIITDGILDVPNLPAFEVVMRQIRARIISCSFVQIGSNNSRHQLTKNRVLNAPIASLGHVPNEELLKFISLSTFGSFIYFDVDHISGESTLLTRLFCQEEELINVCKRFQEFQNELLSWGFHKAVDENSVSSIKKITNGSLNIEVENNRNNKLKATCLPIACKLVNQTVLQTSLDNVLSLRLREGYTVRHVQIQKDEIEVHLVLPWRYDIQIYYIARSVWPIEKSVRTDIRVYKEAPIYFLQDINQLSYSQTPKAANMMRNNLIRRYNDVIQTVSVTDRHLTLINTFARNSSYYNITEAIKRGKTIFYLSQNDLQQTLLLVKDPELQDFADFWRPIVILDGSLWQRFMYTHHLTIILVNDPLSNALFLLNNHLSQSHNNHIQSTVSCRIAKNDFEAFLSEYFSFVLLDGQAYIKFLFHSSGGTVPYSFMLLRVMGQPPLLYLKFAFQAKATTVERHKIIEDFRWNLIRLRQRPRMKSGNPNENNRKQQTSTPVSSNSSQRSIPISTISSNSSQRSIPISTVSSSSSQRSISISTNSSHQRFTSPCCVVLNKNIERLMLKPDPFPYESLGIPKPDDDDSQQKNRTELDSKRQALSKFFYIRSFIRSFESIKHSSNIPKRIADIILDTIIRRRLQEGFHFVATHNNIHNLVLEVKMNTPKEEHSPDICRLNSDISFYPDDRARTCLVQYRIYPVEYVRSKNTSPSRDNNSASLRRSSSIHSDQPTCYYFLTQCWVEPQDGFVDTNCPELEFLNQCTYKQIVDKSNFATEHVLREHTHTRTDYQQLRSYLHFVTFIDNNDDDDDDDDDDHGDGDGDVEIGEVDRECFNTLVSFYFVKYLPERSTFLPRVISRAPRALTSDIIRVPFIQDTINLIRRSSQTHFDFSAFIDDYYKIKYDYINSNGTLTSPSLNSTLLSVLRERLCSKTYESKPQLFSECNDNSNLFTRNLITRSYHSINSRLPVGLQSLKSNPYLLYLLNYHQQQTTKLLTDLERFLIDMLFPHWDFLVCADNDEYVYMILLPKTERDLLLLNTDLTTLMHDLIAYYSFNHIDNKVPIYEDCRCVMEGLFDDIEHLIGIDSPHSPPSNEKLQNKLNDEYAGRHHQRRRQRRDTFTSGDSAAPHSTHLGSNSSKSTISTSPIPISHQLNQHLNHSSSQPTPLGYRRIYSPLTIDTSSISHAEHSMRRYSASAVVSPPVHNHNHGGTPSVNVIPPTPREVLLNDMLKKFPDHQWHIPIYLYGCNKLRLASSLLLSNELQLRNFYSDTYVDYTKDDIDYSTITSTTTAPTSQTLKPRKRDNSRRHDDESLIPQEKLVQDMRDSIDYAIATAFYKNCLLDLTTNSSDVEYALNTIYRDHYEEIELTPFLKAMCAHLSNNELNSIEFDSVCEPTTRHINSYLNDKFIGIISKFFHRVAPDSDYFYFFTDEDGFRQTRNSAESEDRLSNNHNNHNNNNNNNNNNELQSASGPYKFDDTNVYDHETDDDDDDRDSNQTVHVHDNNDDEDPELQLATHRRRSDLSSSSLSNRSRELSVRGEILPLFICFASELDSKVNPLYEPVRTIPLCISGLMSKTKERKIDYDNLRILFDFICLTFEREDADAQGANSVVTTNTPTFSNSFLSTKRLQEFNAIDAIENASTCTGTTMGIEIEWLLRDEQLSTYFSRRTLDRKLIENVIEHVQSSVNIQKSNCLCRSIDLMFVLGIDKSRDPFIEDLKNIRIRNKYGLTKCGIYFVLLKRNDETILDMFPKRNKILSVTSNDDQSSSNMEESSISESSIGDDDDEKKSSEDELDDYIKPSFWLFVEQRQKPSTEVDLLEVKFYLYCGSSSDATQNSIEPQAILEELMNEFNRLCRRINQKLLLSDLAANGLCNSLLVPPGETDEISIETDAPILTANLKITPGTFACDELWRHSFPLHLRLRPHLQTMSSYKSSSGYHPGSLIRELTTTFNSFAVHNRKNLFVYRGEPNNYYMRFREDTLPPSTSSYVDDSLVLSESANAYGPPPSPQIHHQNSAPLNSNLKNRQRHDSGTFCVHVMLYGLESATTDPTFENLKINLIQMIVNRLEEEVVKELVNALYHFAMTRLNPDDVTFIRPIESEPKHVFEYKISPYINTNAFLYYFRRYVKTNQFHQPLLLPVLAKDLKEIIKDYRGQTLIVYNRTYHMGIPRPGLAWIELHVLNPTNRPSPLSTEDLSDELTVKSLIDLIHIVERKSPSSSPSGIDGDNSSENILRCHVWTRGSSGEIEASAMSSTLLQAFTYALADYVTEYKLLPSLYNNQRHGGFEPPPSPRSMATVRFADESNFVLDRNIQTYGVETIPTTPTLQSRRRPESMQSSMLSNSSMDEPQSLPIEHAHRLTAWFQHLSQNYPKLPSVTYGTYTLNNRILLIDIIQHFTSWLNDQKFIAYKHESLHGIVLRCNQEQTLYLPLPTMDQMPPRVPGEKIDLIVLYQSTRLANDVIVESIEPSPQQESGDAMALANSSDILKQIFLCVVANDKKLTMILYNAPDELSKLLTNYFSNLINWTNKRLNFLSILVAQKMGLFRYRSFHNDQQSDYNRHHSPHGSVTHKHSVKTDHVDLEQLIKETIPPKTKNIYTSWNIDLLYCNLVGAYPPLSSDSSQDLIQRHGTQLLQLRENKKIHMDRCTRLEEICSNWLLRPKLLIADDVLIQMKHRSRLLALSVTPILFSRHARQFFQNNSTLRTNNALCLDASSAPSSATFELLSVYRMANKRKSVAIPVDFALRRSGQSIDENDYQITQNQLARFDTSRLNNIEPLYIQITSLFIEQFSNHLQTTYKYNPISTKLNSRKVAHPSHVQTPIECNFHRSDHNKRVTLLAELSSVNNVQIVIRFLQYDIVKIPNSNQSASTIHFRPIPSDSNQTLEQIELDAFAYDFHLQTIIRYQTNLSDAQMFPTDFSVISFLQDFIEYYPTPPIGSKTALFRTVIHHQIDITKRSADAYLFKYVLEHAATYNIQITKRNSDEYLFDCEQKDIYWMAARTTPSSSSELTVVLYIIYTKLIARQPNASNVVVPSLNKIPLPSASNLRVTNSLNKNGNNNQPRERASTILPPSGKNNLVIPVRSNSFGSEQNVGINIPVEQNVGFFKAKLISILTKASLSHRRESLWERLIASRTDNAIPTRQEIMPIQMNEFQSLIDSCVGDEIIELKTVTTLLQRVFSNKEQVDRLNRFLRSRYGSQFHPFNSSSIHYLVIFQYKAPQQCDVFLVLVYRSDQNTLKSYLVKHRNNIDCASFVQTFTQRITYFLWECLT